uniref:Immunoglobulin subtype domain-containing protein n=1 Tax=Sinocyclocheilus anshuiensis TaxID=1608454 RepID=A0A671SEX1_9TELE
MSYCLSTLIRGLMLKACSKGKQTNVGTSDGLVQVNGLNSAADSRWSRPNIHLNDQTRELTIRNIRRDQSGDYKVEINTSSMILHRKLRINISGVFSFDGVKKMSVRDGDPVTLQTRITNITADNVIQWTFGPQNTSVVKTDRESRRIIYNEHDVRFTDRLHLNIQTGDLTISNTKTEVSGLYQIKIIKRTYTIQKSFSVTVSAQSGAASGICGAGVGLVVWAVTVFFATRSISNQGKGVSVNIK